MQGSHFPDESTFLLLAGPAPELSRCPAGPAPPAPGSHPPGFCRRDRQPSPASSRLLLGVGATPLSLSCAHLSAFRPRACYAESVRGGVRSWSGAGLGGRHVVLGPELRGRGSSLRPPPLSFLARVSVQLTVTEEHRVRLCCLSSTWDVLRGPNALCAFGRIRADQPLLACGSEAICSKPRRLVACKQRTLTSHAPGGWKSEVRGRQGGVLVRSCSGLKTAAVSCVLHGGKQGG